MWKYNACQILSEINKFIIGFSTFAVVRLCLYNNVSDNQFLKLSEIIMGIWKNCLGNVLMKNQSDCKMFNIT